jgi:DNA-binding response OmpR family regulator
MLVGVFVMEIPTVIENFSERRDNAINETLKNLQGSCHEQLPNSTVIEEPSQRGQQNGVLQVRTLTIRIPVPWNDLPLQPERREFALLAFIANNSKRAFNPKQLLDLASLHEIFCESERKRTVNVHIRAPRLVIDIAWK